MAHTALSDCDNSTINSLSSSHKASASSNYTLFALPYVYRIQIYKEN